MSAPQEYVEVFKPTSGRFLGVVGVLVCAGVVAIALVDPGSGIGVTGVAVAVLVENGGDRALEATGGSVAAPIGRAVIAEALRDAQ